MAPTNRDTEKDRLIAFAAGLFQEDITVRTLLESLAQGVVIVDRSGTIIQVNSAAARMFGYARTELIGQPHALLIPERFRPRHEKLEDEYFANPKVRPMGQLLDLNALRKDGSEFPVEISLSYLQTIHGILVLSFVNDITLRKSYERQLKEGDELFRTQVECVEEYAIFMIDTDGRVLNWNAGAERLMGYKDKEIIGRHFSCFCPETAREAGKPAQLLKRAAREGSLKDQGWRLRKDASPFWAEIVITPLYDEGGALRGYSMVTHDITERRRAEQALQETEQKLRHIVEHSTNLFYIHTVDQVFTYVSPQSRQFFDCEPEEAMVKWTDFITDTPTNRAAIEATERAIKTAERQPAYRVECIGRKGRRIWVEVNEAPVVENGEVVAIVGSLTDITESKESREQIEKLNAELEIANRELEAFNYTVAHDLRKPLTVINGYCQAIREWCGDSLDEKCSQFIDEAYEGTLRMHQLIEALLDFSRIGRVEPQRKRVDLTALAREVAKGLDRSEPGRRVVFRIAEGIIVDGDETLLRVVLYNLLDNAWKYTSGRKEAHIEVGEAEVDGRPICFVRDNGIGFAMDYAEKILLPFHRLSDAGKYSGFGIGLATVERIIRRHGGRVWAKSEPGEGATFYFTLGDSG